MSPDDMFLKVELTAYFPVNGLKIEKKEFPNDPDSNGIYLKGRRIMPLLSYYLDEGGAVTDLPKSMRLENDSSSWKEEFVSREQIWKEDPTAQRMDETIEELNEQKSDIKI